VAQCNIFDLRIIKASISCHLKNIFQKEFFLNKGNIMNKEINIIEQALLADSSVIDCAVIAKFSEISSFHYVAYLTSNASLSLSHLNLRLQKKLPSNILPKFYSQLSYIPRNFNGEIDRDCLFKFQINDETLIQKWEDDLTSLNEIDQAVIVLREESQSPEPLYLPEILPNFSKNINTSTIELIDTDLETHVNNNLALKNLDKAIAVGSSLSFDSLQSLNLQEILCSTALNTADNKITYLNSKETEINLSYSNLLDQAQHILGGLRALKLEVQDKVILQLENNEDIISAFWGCILGGFVPVILPSSSNYNDYNSSVEKLCNLWHILDQPLIVTSEKLLTDIGNIKRWLTSGNLKICSIEQLNLHTSDIEHYVSNPDDIALLNLTSGSTGLPKCIMLTHRNLISRAIGTNQLCGHSNKDVILNWLPFDHIGSISDWHIRCVILGCRLTYVSKEYILSNPLNWLNLIHKYRITHSWAPNFAYSLINDSIKPSTNYNWDLSCVQALLTAGESVSSQSVDIFEDKLAPYGFSRNAIRPAFGMAEVGSGITYAQPDAFDFVKSHTIDKAFLTREISRVSKNHSDCITFADLGPVIPGVTIRIVDNDNIILTEETIGKLQIKGDAVFIGYYRNPEANQEAFLEDGWFNTGDLAFISKGHLVVTGRVKETIIINGSNFYNHEIESVVEEIKNIDISYTAACAVRDRPSSTDKLAIFFSTLCTGSDLTTLLRKIRTAVLDKVGVNPDFLVPVSKVDIPKTQIGKIQRLQLAKRFENGEFNSILREVDLLLLNSNTLPNWFCQRTWQPKSPRNHVNLNLKNFCIVFISQDTSNIFFCDSIRHMQLPTITVEIGSEFLQHSIYHYCLNPNESDHYHKLFDLILKSGVNFDKIFHLWTYENKICDIHTLDELENAQTRGALSLVYITQALDAFRDKGGDVIQFTIISRNIHHTSPNFKSAFAYAPIIGIIKAISLEMSWIDCRHIDLDDVPSSTDNELIINELQVIDNEVEVAYRNGQRLVPRLSKVNFQADNIKPLPFYDGGFYLVTGGLGGIGAEISKYLINTYNAKVLIVGRSRLPERELWEQHLKLNDELSKRIKIYQELEKLNGEIRYISTNICNHTLLQYEVDLYSNLLGRSLDGVIHLAGTFHERLLTEESLNSFSDIIQAKVYGTWSLHQLVKDRPGTLFINFSSLSSFFGGAGISGYSAANNFLESFSHYQAHHTGLKSYCFGWSTWGDIGMSRENQLKSVLLSKGFCELSAKQGLNSLVIGLCYDLKHLLVGIDTRNQNTRSFVIDKPYEVNVLTAYFTTKENKPISFKKLKSIEVRDTYKTLSNCRFHRVHEMPTLSSGEIDKEKLIAITSKTGSEKVLPRNEIEKTLVNIWQEVLGNHRIGITDNFFELGGSSLLAAKVFSKIEEVFSYNLPLSTLFQSPTIQQIAALLVQEDWVAPWSSLVPIQPHGSGPPLFCVGGVGGNVLCYQPLSILLGPDQPFYGLQAKGLDGQEAPHFKVEDMASQYLTEVLKLQPNGPYFLAGHSLGGLVAFEMAQQLKVRGQSVNFLGLFDTYTPEVVNNPPEIIYMSYIFFLNLLRLRNLEKLTFIVARLKFRFEKILRNRSTKRLYQAHMQAAKTYSPQVYQGEVTLYKASSPKAAEGYLYPRLGWEKIVVENLNVHEVPGGHAYSDSLLCKPHVNILAEKLKNSIKQNRTISF
jgi:acyl-CoA synthetase (AMP-forming)/AMP-acid ligase II/thioesterase domain-containing protein/NAD(P)-dependent dehydrogenase (short-subunit alcohol dehydrogenase family)/acyl carrier protein